MGSFSNYQQTVPGGNLGVSGEQTTGLTPNVLPGLQIDNFGYFDQSFAESLRWPRRRARRFRGYGLLSEPREPFNERDLHGGQAHDCRRWRLQLHATEYHQ